MTLIWMALMVLVPAGVMAVTAHQPQRQKVAVRARR